MEQRKSKAFTPVLYTQGERSKGRSIQCQDKVTESHAPPINQERLIKSGGSKESPYTGYGITKRHRTWYMGCGSIYGYTRSGII